MILWIFLAVTLAAWVGTLAWVYTLRRRMRELKRRLRNALRERDRASQQAGG